MNEKGNRPTPNIDLHQLKRSLLSKIDNALFHLFPNGTMKENKFYIGNIKGDKGKSLIVQLDGKKQGNWFDFATDEGGDIIRLWQEKRGYSKSEFPKLLNEINEWLGNVSDIPEKQTAPKSPPMDHLGKPTAKWDYLNKDNKIIACVYRYDNADGKEFRVWDVSKRKSKAPDIRPLYNIPGIAKSKKVVIVEGEKSADALITIGITATTAMFGANAPLNKTDFSPLKDKEIIIWPDNDVAGIDYARKLSKHLQNISFVISILTPPEGKKDKWDAFDAVSENFDVRSFLNGAKSVEIKIPSFSISEFLSDNSPMPEDLIYPRLLTPSGLLLIGGAPKVGKSDFLINFLIHMAAGEKFLGFSPPRPLKIFYLQAEIGYHYMRERIKRLKVSKETLFKASKNLISTANIQMILDDQGIEAVRRTIKVNFPDSKPDIICIDPIRNLFDGGSDGASENDNSAMLFFLQNRIEKLRNLVNPSMGIILCHHTKKIKKKDLEEDPFQAFSGAGSLRSFYSSGLILHKPDELDSRVNIYFELRNGSAIPRKIVEKENGKWVEINPLSERFINKDYSEKLDAERVRKGDVILEIIAEESRKGKLYTAIQFAEHFENSAGLGATKTIRDRVAVLSTKGHVKFIKNAKQYGFECARSRYGILCVEGMKFPNSDGQLIHIFPSHYKCSNTGSVLPVENNQIWVNHKGEETS